MSMYRIIKKFDLPGSLYLKPKIKVPSYKVNTPINLDFYETFEKTNVDKHPAIEFFGNTKVIWVFQNENIRDDIFKIMINRIHR